MLFRVDNASEFSAGLDFQSVVVHVKPAGGPSVQ